MISEEDHTHVGQSASACAVSDICHGSCQSQGDHSSIPTSDPKSQHMYHIAPCSLTLQAHGSTNDINVVTPRHSNHLSHTLCEAESSEPSLDTGNSDPSKPIDDDHTQLLQPSAPTTCRLKEPRPRLMGSTSSSIKSIATGQSAKALLCSRRSVQQCVCRSRERETVGGA